MKTIDAGHGGGQVLRSALSLSAVIGQAVEITNIRKNRPKPGLQPQHQACVDALVQITKGKAHPATLGAQTIRFTPRHVQGGHYTFDIGTAGSCSLLLQCILPPLLLAKQSSTIKIVGGTDVPMAPPSLFVQHCFVPALQKMGASVKIRIEKHGFYPQGGGQLHAAIEPVQQFKPLELKNRGQLEQVQATILTSQLPDHVAQREKKILAPLMDEKNIAVEKVAARCSGNLVFIQAHYENVRLGVDQLGKIGMPAEAVAQNAAIKFQSLNQSPDAIESHLLDQLLIYAALASGTSRFNISTLNEHALSNLRVIHELLDTTHDFDGHALHIHGRQENVKNQKNPRQGIEK